MFLVVASNFRSGATRTPADPPTIFYVRDILDRFRPRLFEFGRPVWKTQADVPTKLLFLNQFRICDICKTLDLWAFIAITDWGL
jgi:hypothetical protein